MSEFVEAIKKFQVILVLTVMIAGFGITYGQLATDVNQAKVEQAEVVKELRAIKEEIVLLRIESARTNARLESHLISTTQE
jgi:hypothetical protein